MKKLFLLAVLLLAFLAPGFATDVIVSSQTLNGFSFQGAAPQQTAVVNISGTTVTRVSGANFQPVGVNGVGGWPAGIKILIAGQLYDLASVTSTTVLTLRTSPGTMTGVPITIYPWVEVRAYALSSWTLPDGITVIQRGQPGSGSWVKRYGASIISNVLYIPQVTLSATTDSPNPGERASARWFVGIYAPNGSTLIQAVNCAEAMRLPPTPASTTWGAICTYNQPGLNTFPVNSTSFNSDQTAALLAASTGTNANEFRLNQDASHATAGNHFDLWAGNATTPPAIRFNSTTQGWELSNNGTDYSAILTGDSTGMFPVDSYGARADGRKARGGISAGGTTFTATTSVFTEADSGKKLYIEGAGALNATGGINGLHGATITYLSPTQVLLSSAAIATVANAVFYWGTDNQAAFDAAVAASIAEGNAAFNANPVNGLGTPLSRGNSHGSGIIQLGRGNYIISSNITLPLGVTLAGAGQGSIFTTTELSGGSEIWSPYAQDYTAPINGIVQTAGFINGSTGAYNTIRDLAIVALDQTKWQSCLDDTGSTYVRVERVRMNGCHWGQIMDQTELSSTVESVFESYGSGSSGKWPGGTAPENIGWTKVGSVASGVEPMVFPDDCWQCGRVTLSPTGTDTTYWKTSISSFSKGFLFTTQTPEVVGVSTDIGRAVTQVLDDGTHHFEINWKGYLTDTPLAANWAAATSYSKYQVAKATATVGAFTSGQAIYSNSTRTSGATFDSSEAANWTSASGMHGFKINNTGPLYPAPFGTTALAINPGGATATLYLDLSSTSDSIASSTIAATASTGTMLAFGDFDATNNNNASTYWNLFEWTGTWPTAVGLWMPPNDDHWQHRETYTRTQVAMYSGDAQVICRSCTMSSADVGKSVTVVGAGPAGGNLTATINSYFGDGYVFTTATATPSDTSFTVTNNLNIASPGVWLYSSGEAMYCTGSTATSVTGCTRGLLGSTARTFAVGDSLNVYRTWVLSVAASTSVGINTSAGGSLTVAESAGPQFVNVIQVTNNQFNGPNKHIADEGGYTHKFSGNNFNGGGVAYSNSGSYGISLENSDFEGQSSWPIVLGDTYLMHPTRRGSALYVDIMHNLLSSAKIWQGGNITFTNNLFTPGTGSAIYNSSGGGVSNLNAVGNATQGARLFQQNIGSVEGNRLGGLIPLSANGGLGVTNHQARYDRPVTGPLELHYRTNGSEEEPRGALGAMTAASKTLTITSKYSSTQFYAADVGKTIKVEYAAAANGSNAVLTTTIAAYVSATQVTLTDAAVQTVVNVNTIWYREGAKTPAVTFYDAYDLYGANWANGPTTLSAPTLTISAVSDYSGTVAGTVRGTVNSIAGNTNLTLALASVPWSTGSLTLKIAGTTDYNHYAKTVTYIDDTHVYWTDTYTSSQTGTASYLAGTDPTAPASTLTPKNYYARIQGLSAYTANRTVNMLDASGYMGVTPSLLTQNAWLTVDSSNRITGNTTYATLDPTNGQGMVRQLTIKAATSGTATDTMLALQANNGSSGWLLLYDYPSGWLTLQDGVASRQQMTVIANATYDYLQLHANEGINWAGYGTAYTSAGGIAKNGSSILEINRGKKIADGGATGDLILRNLRMQLSGASSAVYFNYTGTPTAARAIAMPDMSSTFVGSSGALTAGRIPFGVAIDSGVGLTDSSQLIYVAPTLTLAATHTGGSATLLQLNLTKPNVDQLAGWWQFNTNTDVSTDFFGKFGYKFEGGTSNSSRHFQIYVSDSTTPKMVVGGTGLVGIGTISAGAMLQVNTSGTGVIGQIIKATAGQTADLFEVQASDSTVIFKVTNTGRAFIQPQTGVDAYVYMIAATGQSAGQSFTTPGGGTMTTTFDNSGNFFLQQSAAGGGSLFLDYKTAFYLRDSSSNQKEYVTGAIHNLQSGTVLGWSSSATVASTAADVGLVRNAANTLEINTGTAGVFADLKLRQLYADATMTTGGTTGAQTINKSAGSVNFAIAATSLVVTNSLVSTSSIVVCSISTNDATFTGVQCVPGAGSFTIYANAAATAETKVAFLVINR